MPTDDPFPKVDTSRLVADQSTTDAVPPGENFGALVRSVEDPERGFRLARMLDDRGVDPQDIIFGGLNKSLPVTSNDRASFNPMVDVMGIPDTERDIEDQVVAEMAHAQQDQQDGDIAMIMVGMGDQLAFGEKGQYSEPGTLEFMAHRVIEPRLREELESSGATKPQNPEPKINTEEILRER